MEPSENPLYFDTAATTHVAPEVVARMTQQLGSETAYANPSSDAHLPGQAAATVVSSARNQIAAELRCEADEVVFTSGATEANNLALQGIARAHAAYGRHIVTSAIEHKSVLETCRALEQEGFRVTYVKPDRGGRVAPRAIADVIQSDTLLVSLMHTNNETGVMQPIAEVADVAAEVGVLFHVDAAQGAGKFPIDLDQTPIDLLSLSAHKFHGPKGSGCLVVRNRRRLRLRPLLYGGGQEFGLRPGTLATHQIVGLSEALALAAARREADVAHVAELKRQFLARLGAKLRVNVHGDRAYSSPYIINFSIPGIVGDALISQLSARLAIATGSACTSGTVDPSYVLRAMGLEDEPLYGAVRLSFSRDHSFAEVAEAVDRIVEAVERMREID